MQLLYNGFSQRTFNFCLTGTAGLEPAAGGLEIRYSIQLSYAPKYTFAYIIKICGICLVETENLAKIRRC